MTFILIRIKMKSQDYKITNGPKYCIIAPLVKAKNDLFLFR